MNCTRIGFVVLAAAVGLAEIPPCSAANLEVSVKNSKGELVQDAVVYARVVGQSDPITNGEAIVDQVDKEFIPYVMPIKVGTAVKFPNHDNIRHHVYSFSSAKTFEIPLYLGTPREPVVFDQPGVVVLGCNIHDWMASYVFVSDSPYFALTGESGKAMVDSVPAGEYDVTVWHPRLRGEADSLNQRITVESGGTVALAFEIEQRRVWRARRAPSASGGSYK